jgi:hypothetical protein
VALLGILGDPLNTIEKLTQYSQHVQDEATTTADLLNDASALLTDACAVIDQLISAQQSLLRRHGYEPYSESCNAGYALQKRIRGY